MGKINEAKAQLEHGQWGKWLENKVQFTRNCKKIYEMCRRMFKFNRIEFGSIKIICIIKCSIRGKRRVYKMNLMRLMEKEKTVYEMTKRELQQAIKEKRPI